MNEKHSRPISNFYIKERKYCWIIKFHFNQNMAKYLQIWTFKKLGDDHYGRKLFHTGYIDIDFIHFEGTFLTNIIARQSNGEVNTTTTGHNYLNLLQNTVRKLSREFPLVPTAILLIWRNILTSMLKWSSTNEVKSLLTSSAYTLAQQNTSSVLIRSKRTLTRTIIYYCQPNLKET